MFSNLRPVVCWLQAVKDAAIVIISKIFFAFIISFTFEGTKLHNYFDISGARSKTFYFSS